MTRLRAIAASVVLTFFLAGVATAQAAEWAPWVAYTIGQVVTYQGPSYQCRQSHTSQPGWEPPNTLALWLPVSGGTATATATATRTPTRTATKTATSRISPTRTNTATATRTTTPTPTSCAGAAAIGATACGSPTPPKRVGAYFLSFGVYGRAFFPKAIDTSGNAARLSHLTYTWENVKNGKCSIGLTQVNEGDIFADYERFFGATDSVDGVADTFFQPIKGNWNQLRKLKIKYPNLKVLVSLGGPFMSDELAAAAQPANRAALVASCIDVYIRGNLPDDSSMGVGGPGSAVGVFDGFDLNWQWPAAADSANYAALLAEFRKQLNAEKPGLVLSASLPAQSDKLGVLPIGSLAGSVDFVNLLAVDFFVPSTHFGAGAARPTGPTAFHAALNPWTGMPQTSPANTYYADYAVNQMTAAGFPAAKINLVVPFYGTGWTGVSATNNGLNQPAAGPAACAGGGCGEAGFEDYRFIVPKAHPRFYGAGTASSFYQGEWWSFDDAQSSPNKVAYVRSKGLGGATALWIDGDTASGELL
jgi:chitinase